VALHLRLSVAEHISVQHKICTAKKSVHYPLKEQHEFSRNGECAGQARSDRWT